MSCRRVHPRVSEAHCGCDSFHAYVNTILKKFIPGKYVFASLVVTFRHGREEDEVMGVSFQKELVVDRVQVFPGNAEKEKSKMQVH